MVMIYAAFFLLMLMLMLRGATAAVAADGIIPRVSRSVAAAFFRAKLLMQRERELMPGTERSSASPLILLPLLRLFAKRGRESMRGEREEEEEEAAAADAASVSGE